MGDRQDGPGDGGDRFADRLTALRPTTVVGESLELEELERRHRRLFLVAAFAAVGAAAIAAAAVLLEVELPDWAGWALLATTAVFVWDAIAQERATHVLMRRATAERSRSRELDRSLDHLATLQSIARRVNSVLLPEAIYEVVLDGALELLGGVAGEVRLRVEQTLTVVASCGVDAPPLGETVQLDDAEGIVAVVRLGLSRRTAEPPEISVPILVGERIVGVLTVRRGEGDEPFSDRREALAALFADVAATAFLNANRYDHERMRADVAVSLSKDRSDQVADAVHDLRAPLSGLMGFAQLLRDRHEDLTDEARESLVADVYTQALVLEGLVAEIFDATAAAARATRTRDQVRLDEVARDAIATVRAAADGRGWSHRIALDVSGEPIVLGDAEALRRVVTNLVDNAVEHAGPEVLVRVQRRGGEVRLHVADHGAGIAHDELDELFVRDRRRGDTASPRGRGLPIVDTLVRSMGGRVGVRSQEGVGSVFSVMLPTARAEA